MSVSTEPVGATSGITSNYYARVRQHSCCAFPVDVWHIDGTGNVRSKMRGTVRGGQIP